jgi:hypothetical protein
MKLIQSYHKYVCRRSFLMPLASVFLKGPVLMRHVAAANRPSGQALALLLAILRRMDLTGKPMVTLPRGLLDELGVSKDAKPRGLRLLEGAGLIVVDRSKGKAARIGLAASARNS